MPYQEAPSPPMTPELARACERAAHVILSDGGVLKAGRAALYVFAQLGFPRTARILGWVPFIWGVELAYYIVARNRRFFSRFLFRPRAPR